MPVVVFQLLRLRVGDQFYGCAAGGFAFLPNSLLKPEELNGGELGVDFVRSNLRA